MNNAKLEELASKERRRQEKFAFQLEPGSRAQPWIRLSPHVNVMRMKLKWCKQAAWACAAGDP
jgi:hypothetical protein